jgi:peptide deformylase
MSVRPIYLYGSNVLRTKARSVAELDPTTVGLIADMVETMRHANGIGLAATQVGELKRVIVIDVSAVENALQDEEESEQQSAPQEQKEQKTLVLINPEILHQEGTWTMEEGCLSIPGVRADVERAETIRIRYRNGGFEAVEETVDGLLARVMLHEIDHLNGILFIDHLSTTQRALLKSKLRKIRKGEVEASYPVTTDASSTVPTASRVGV